MAQLDRIYERTDAGARMLNASGAGLRADARVLLALLDGRAHGDCIRTGMRRFSEERIVELLAELERLRLIRSTAATPEHDLDFTGPLALRRK